MDRSVVLDALDTMVRVQVLVKRDLEDGGTTLATDDDAVGEEEDPNPVPLLAVGLDDVLLIANPVLVPPVDSGGVVDAKDVNILNLETSALKL